MFKEKSFELAALAYTIMIHDTDDQGMGHRPSGSDVEIDHLESMHNMEITREIFAKLCQHPEFTELLCDLDIAEGEHADLFDTLDADGSGTLDVDEFVTGIGKLRGEARKSDMVSVLLKTRHITQILTEVTETL